MSESASHWGEVAEHDHEMAEVWDRFERLPEPGHNDMLDALCRAKRVSIPALVKIGARLADARTLAFAGPGYIKYRSLEDGRKWAYLGSEYPELKVIPAGVERAETVLVCEGETDAARLTMLYPECDVAALPNGVDAIGYRFGDQLAAYRRVVIATDADRGGERGAERILKLRPDAVRMAPPTKDWCELASDPPALPELASTDFEIVGGIRFESLDLDEHEPDPEILVEDLLYGTGVHLLSGHPGDGKSTIAMHIAIQIMAAGGHVIWLDYEMGKRQAKRRLAACGCSSTMAAEFFHYAQFPLKVDEHLPELVARWPGAFVVIDSMSKALASAGINENANEEVTKWNAAVVKAVKTYEFPLYIIDHVAKNPKDRKYSRGAGSKLADVDVHLSVEVTAPFNKELAGTLTLHQEKDRDGFFEFQSWWAIGDGKGNLTLERLSSPPAADDEPDNRAPAI